MASVASNLSVARTQGNSSGNGGDFFRYHGIWAPGIRLFRQMRFASKALMISVAMVVPVLVLLCVNLYTGAERDMQSRLDATRQHVEVAYGFLTWAYGEQTAGRRTAEEAQKDALQAIAQLRYDGKEYFWINDLEPRMIMHPIKPELNGKEIGGIKDPNGFALFSAMVEKVKRDGEGQIQYQWPKPGSSEPVDKISYVKGFAPWGWIVGSGVYVDDIRVRQHEQILTALATLAVSLLLSLYLFLSFYRVMSGGLNETRRHLRAMTEGDLTNSPSPWGKDEAAELMNDLSRMQDSLRTVVQRVRNSSDTIHHSSAEIASASNDLSRRTEHAAASLEESAASMEEIMSTSRHGADATAEAARVAQHNAEVAANGGKVMGEMVNTMDQIRDSSNRIREIIGTIDGIAFQTNILALNAAVEAARAGELGRGFAIVANEVRMLAQRSADAAREIKSLIESSVSQVESGGAIVRRAGEAIHEIVEASMRVDRLLGEVSHGANEQGTGIRQIGQSVQELDQSTQQNAALVEQTAAAAAQLASNAEELAREVSHFRLS